MDERTSRMISGYIPSAPDQELEENQYYFDHGGRIIKVFPRDILPQDRATEYGLYQQVGANLRWVDARGDEDRCRGVEKGQLYDNKEDCRNHTHDQYNNWEELREIQRGGT